MSEFPREEREMPFGDYTPDDTTHEQYAAAIAELGRFLKVELRSINGLADLNAILGKVGVSLYHVLQSKGHVQTTEFGYRKGDEEVDTAAIDRTQVFRKPINDHYVFMASKPEGMYCDAYVLPSPEEQTSIFMASIPFEAPKRQAGPLANMFDMYAVDWRTGTAASYDPLQEPHSADICQGYAKVVQDLTKDIFNLVPSPTEGDNLPQ